MRTVLKFLAIAAVATVGGVAVETSGVIPGIAIEKAEARVGRPLTPMSYAGVARRTTRRAVAAGAATRAAVSAGVYYYYVPGCARYIDPYGRVYYRCP